MEDIVVDIYKLNQYAQRLSTVNDRVKKLDQSIDSLYAKVGLAGLYDLIRVDAMICQNSKLVNCQQYLRQTATDFETVERQLVNQELPEINSHNTLAQNSFNQSGQKNEKTSEKEQKENLGKASWNDLVIKGKAESALSLLLGNLVTKFWNEDLEYTEGESVWEKVSKDGEDYIKIFSAEGSSSIKPTKGTYTDKKIIGDSDHLNINVEQTKIKDGDKQVNSDESWYKKKGTIFEGKEEVKIEGSILDGRLNGSNDWSEGSIEGKLLTAEAHAEAAAGLYIYTKDKNGNTKKILSPGVSAEVGTSVAVVDVEADGRIGLGEEKNMLGLYGNVDAELLSAEAKGKISVNLGKEVYVEAGAEANLAKISGSGGISVLGADVGVSGSLKVGIGAHAQAGYTDGKLKVDIGAAVGVGFDVGFEIDVGGTVDAVCDAASGIWDGATDIWNGTVDAISDAWDWWF